MEFHHIPVLADEVISQFELESGNVFVDGTLGGGNHAERMLKAFPGIHLIGIDQDEDALAAAQKRLAPYGDRVTFVRENYRNIRAVLERLDIPEIHGGLLDIGVSSYQLDEGERGFSFHHDAPLDMRMDRRNEKTARDVVNTYTKEELAEIFWKYGEENWGLRIAEFIVRERKEKPIETTSDLVRVIRMAIPKRVRENAHPGRKVFQAIRIEVNDELGALEEGLEDFVDALAPKGRLAVITFHSLEDRIVKQTFRTMSQDCICPKDFPVCVCGHVKKLRIVNTKPITASKDECKMNPRSRSAKLRVGEKIEQRSESVC